MTEGIIKFSFEFSSRIVPNLKEVDKLNFIRKRLIELGLIGVGRDKISFGNVSHRLGGNSFLITASQTGNKKILQPSDFVIVRNFDINKNQVYVDGIHPPSSESLTHAAVYCAKPFVKIVAHFHHKELWKKLYGIALTTNPEAEYGTIELAKSLFQLLNCRKDKINNIVVLGGHKNGIIVFSENVKELLTLIIKLWDDLKQI